MVRTTEELSWMVSLRPNLSMRNPVTRLPTICIGEFRLTGGHRLVENSYK